MELTGKAKADFLEWSKNQELPIRLIHFLIIDFFNEKLLEKIRMVDILSYFMQVKEYTLHDIYKKSIEKANEIYNKNY